MQLAKMLAAKLVLCCLLAVALAEEAILRTPEQVHEYMEALIKSREGKILAFFNQ